jgi:hypothetical protein
MSTMDNTVIAANIFMLVCQQINSLSLFNVYAIVWPVLWSLTVIEILNLIESLHLLEIYIHSNNDKPSSQIFIDIPIMDNTSYCC